MSVKVFVDPGIEDPRTFCSQWLESPDFLLETLKKFSDYGSDKKKMASNVAEKLSRNQLEPEMVLLEYFKQPRQWFTYKVGEYRTTPDFEDPEILLRSFGEEQWYGPIYSEEQSSMYFIRIFEFPYYEKIGGSEDAEILEYRIRWSLIANVDQEKLSLYWNGFTRNQRDKISSHSQFPFWLYVPEAIIELEDLIDGEYDFPNVHEIVLNHIWDRYITNSEYNWRHLAIRAEASGVNLNARSKGVEEISPEGLLSLAEAIAKSIIDDVFGNIRSNKRKKELLERAKSTILRTLIHKWGAKSYEFSLSKDKEKLFRAHCYFGFKPTSSTQDRFPHFKSFKSYGGAFGALNFLLEESSS